MLTTTPTHRWSDADLVSTAALSFDFVAGDFLNHTIVELPTIDLPALAAPDARPAAPTTATNITSVELPAPTDLRGFDFFNPDDVDSVELLESGPLL